MVFIFFIILVLIVCSSFYLNKLSNKTSAILKENYLSVVYAQEMSEGLMNINQEMINSSLSNKVPDSLFVRKEFYSIDQSFGLEKNNITENGEDKLVASIQTGIKEYRKSFEGIMKSPLQASDILLQQKRFNVLHQQLLILSQMNGKAIESKTDDAKVSAKDASAEMIILGSICFLIALSFMYSFATYFNERFFQLYNGIKEIVSSNYGQRLYFEGSDEFYEISLLFNQMAEKLDHTNPKMSLNLEDDFYVDDRLNDIQEMKNVLFRMKVLEAQAKQAVSRLENMK
jgi:methyl-accepting chemotaxis protein